MPIRKYKTKKGLKKITVRYSKSHRIDGKPNTASKETTIDDIGQSDEELEIIYNNNKEIVLNQIKSGEYHVNSCPDNVKSKIKRFEKLQENALGYVKYKASIDYNYKKKKFYDVVAYGRYGSCLRTKLSQVTESELLSFIEQETAKLNLVEE